MSASCGIPWHEPCDDCGGEVDTRRTVPIRVHKTDEDGFPDIDLETGELLMVTIPLPFHVLDLTHATFNASGLVPAMCAHGLEQHPDPAIQADRHLAKYATSWIRSKHLDPRGLCPVDRGEPAPADLVTPR